jgi:uncharacterized protein YndB with AHSA1/START domain
MGNSPHEPGDSRLNNGEMLLREFHGHASLVIDADPKVVFAAVTQVERLPEWNKRIAAVIRQPDASLAEGAEWVVQMSVSGAKWLSRSRVVRFDAEHLLFEYTTQTDDGNPSFALWRWTVDPMDEGAKVRVEWAAYPKTFWRQLLFAKLRRRQLRDEAPASLNALAYHLAPVEASQ